MTKRKAIKKTEELSSVFVSYTCAKVFGSLFGGLLSVAVVTAKQAILPTLAGKQFWLLSAVIAGGLLYSAMTVYDFGKLLTGNKYKSAGMVALFEGVAVFIPLGTLWQTSSLSFALGILFVASATACLSAINAHTMAQNCVSRFVERSERVAWATHRKQQNMAKLAKLKA